MKADKNNASSSTSSTAALSESLIRINIIRRLLTCGYCGDVIPDGANAELYGDKSKQQRRPKSVPREV